MVAAARSTLAMPVSVLAFDTGTIVDRSLSGLLSRRLAELVATATAASPPALLALAGGQTARSVLTALGISRLIVRGTVNGGAALSTTDAGMTIVTRPGSFGAADDLVRILERVAPVPYSTLGT
jgi:4-hydroxythreonine-4-phosphate dehydrogenase